MKIELGFAKTPQYVEIPDENVQAILEPNEIKVDVTGEAVVREALNHPVGTKKIEEIVKEGIEKKEIKEGNAKVIASEIYGLICSALVCKLRNEQEFDIMNLYKEFENTVIQGLKN